MKFKNFAVYENYISGTQTSQQNPVVQYLKSYPGYTSLSTNLQQSSAGNGSATARWNQYTGVDSIDAKIADLLEDTAFVSIINADGIVQIGDYYVQYNPFTDKVLVMHQSHHATTYQALINKDENNRNIFVFTAADDVLAYFEENNFPITPPRGSNVVEWPLANGRMRVNFGPYMPDGFPICPTNPLFDPALYTKNLECGANPTHLNYSMGCIYRGYGIFFTLKTRMLSTRSLDRVFFANAQAVHFHDGNFLIWWQARGSGSQQWDNENMFGRNVARVDKNYYRGGRSLMRLRMRVLPNSSQTGYPNDIPTTNAFWNHIPFDLRIHY